MMVALGCQGDKTQPPLPVAPPPPATTDAALAPDAPPPRAASTHILLPRSPSTPVPRTSRPLGRKELQRLAAITHKDFDREVRVTAAQVTEFRHTTTTRPKLGVTVTIQPCARTRSGRPAKRACLAIDLPLWNARAAQLKQSLGTELVDRPDTRFEIGSRDVSGTPAIYTYQLGYFSGRDKHDQPTSSYSDAYILYYNDGVNQIRVNAAYVDDSVGGIGPMIAVAPEEDLEKLAVAFMSFYLHEWREPK
jgi:hypothetical protein